MPGTYLELATKDWRFFAGTWKAGKVLDNSGDSGRFREVQHLHSKIKIYVHSPALLEEDRFETGEFETATWLDMIN